MAYKYLQKGGRFQREYDYHHKQYYNKDGLNWAKQRAWNCAYEIMESHANVKDYEILRDGKCKPEWQFKFKFLREYGLPHVAQMYNGIVERKGLTEWLKDDVAPLLDALLIDNDKREVEVTSKVRNEYRIKSDSKQCREPNSRRMF